MVPSYSLTGKPLLATLILLISFLRALPSIQHNEDSCDSKNDMGIGACTSSSSSSSSSSSLQNHQEPHEENDNDAADENIELPPLLPDDFIDPCGDEDPRCYEWAVEGECRRNRHYMLSSCAKSCGSCRSMSLPGGGGDQGSLMAGEENVAAAAAICFDEHAGGECHKWAMEQGQCLINPEFMLSKCKYSCWECVDSQRDELLGIPNAEIQRKIIYATMDTGKQQLIREISEDGTNNNPMTSHDHANVISTIQHMDHYAKYSMTESSIDTKTRQRCRNEFRMCAEWASRGLCHSSTSRLVLSHQQFPDIEIDHFYNHPDAAAHVTTKSKDVLFMMNMCPLACGTCHLLESFHKCVGRRHPYSPPSFQSGGELRSFFDKATTHTEEGWAEYEPILASYPNHAIERVDGGGGGMEDRSPVVILRNFVSDSEADHLISLVSALGWRSASTTTTPTTRYSDATPTNVHNVEYASCHDDNRCESNDTYRRIMNRIASLSDAISTSHLEPMTFMRLHSNMAEDDASLQHNFDVGSSWKPAGPRVFTLSLFLSTGTDNDAGGSGGGTGGGIGFPYLDWLHVHPRKGAAVLWPNVRVDDLFEPDLSTSFEYLPLQNGGGDRDSGVVLTVHVRLYNYTDANLRGCA